MSGCHLSCSKIKKIKKKKKTFTFVIIFLTTWIHFSCNFTLWLKSKYSLLQACKRKSSYRTQSHDFNQAYYEQCILLFVIHILFVTAKNSTTPNPCIKTAESGLSEICYSSWSYLQTFCLHAIPSVSQSSWSLCQIDFRFKRNVEQTPKTIVSYYTLSCKHTPASNTDFNGWEGREKNTEDAGALQLTLMLRRNLWPDNQN